MARACLIVLVLSLSCGKSGSGSSDGGPESQAGADTGGHAGTSGSAGTSGTAATSGAASQTGGRAGSGGTSSVGGAGEGGEGTGGDATTGGLGGSVSAGSSAGGASSAGMAGSGGLVPLPLPDGCEAESASEDGVSCHLRVMCGDEERINKCFFLTPERWQCHCGRGRLYEIEGVEGLLPCAVMAELCPVTDPEGDPSCSELVDGSDAYYCEFGEACRRSVDVTRVSGARAWLLEHGSAVCDRNDPRLPFECACFVGDVSQSYNLLAQHGEDACQPLLDFCKTGATPTYDETTQCIDLAEELEYACVLNKICATPMRLTDEVSLARLEEWWSNCYNQPPGSRCDCSGEDGVFDFDLATNPTAPTCASAVLNCSDYENVEPRGSVECQPRSLAAALDYCTADVDCLQPASVNGREIVARSRTKVLCRQRTAGEPWWCSCASNEDSAVFELGMPGATSFEACTGATGRCQDVLPFFIGPSSGYPDPPDPLPPE